MRATRWTAVALGCALLLGACSGDDAAQDTSADEERAADVAGSDDGGMAEEDMADAEAPSDGDLGSGAGDVVTILTPGGGGYGQASDAKAVRH